MSVAHRVLDVLVAEIMLRVSWPSLASLHFRHTCRECAEICQECAESCERVGDMDECVQACRRCAESCRKMAA